MKSFLMRATGAAGVTYAAAHMIYGNAQYASAGGVQIPANIVQQLLPILIGIFYPIIAEKWPWLGTLLGFLKSSGALDELNLLNQLELKTCDCPESREKISGLRQKALEKYKNESTAS